MTEGRVGVVQGQRDRSNGGNGTRERFKQLGLFDIQDRGFKRLTAIVDLGNTHTIRERRDVQHVQERSLRRSDLGSSFDNLEISGNFNGTTSNLGGDTEGLEERCFPGFHTSVSCGNPHVTRRNGTSTGGSSDTVGQNLSTNGLEIIISENKTDIALDKGKEAVDVGKTAISDESLQSTANPVRRVRKLFQPDVNFIHGVLPHEDDT